MITVNIPSALKVYCDNESEVPVDATTIKEALDVLVARFPSLKKHLFDANLQLRSFVNIFLDDEDIRYLNGLETPLKDHREINIIPSIAGGIHVS